MYYKSSRGWCGDVTYGVVVDKDFPQPISIVQECSDGQS